MRWMPMNRQTTSSVWASSRPKWRIGGTRFSESQRCEPEGRVVTDVLTGQSGFALFDSRQTCDKRVCLSKCVVAADSRSNEGTLWSEISQFRAVAAAHGRVIRSNMSAMQLALNPHMSGSQS